MSSTFVAAATRRAWDVKGDAAAAPAILSPGSRAIISGLGARADLNNLEVTLLTFNKVKGRWGTRVTLTGEGVLVLPAKLALCPGLFERNLPDALLCMVLGYGNVPSLRAASRACRVLHRLANYTLASGAFRRKLDFATMTRWRLSRSIYGFVSLDTFQRHRRHPHKPGRVSCRGEKVAHSGCMGMAHLWDTESGRLLAGFRPPMLSVGTCGRMGTAIDELALSPDGAWLVCSIKAHEHPVGEATLPHVVLYDARGEDADCRDGPGHVIGMPQVKGREPRMQMPTEWDVAALGWVSSTEFVALSRPSAHIHGEEHHEHGIRQLWGSRLALFEIRADGADWARETAEILDEVRVNEELTVGLPAQPRFLEALAVADARRLAAVADTHGTIHFWSFGVSAGALRETSFFSSGHAVVSQQLWTTAVSALAFSSSGRALVSVGAHDFTIKVHSLAAADGIGSLAAPTLLGQGSYRDAIGSTPWFPGWQEVDEEAPAAIDESEDTLEMADWADFYHRYESFSVDDEGLATRPEEPLQEGAKFLLESVAVSGERMLVTGHRKGCVCVWDLEGSVPSTTGAAGSGDFPQQPSQQPPSQQQAWQQQAAGCAPRLVATLPPPDAHAPPSTSPTRRANALEPLTASDEMIRGVAVVGTHGIGVAGPALVYASRSGALTKLLTLDSAELSELTEREWDKYEKERPVDELYRDAPWIGAAHEEEVLV